MSGNVVGRAVIQIDGELDQSSIDGVGSDVERVLDEGSRAGVDAMESNLAQIAFPRELGGFNEALDAASGTVREFGGGFGDLVTAMDTFGLSSEGAGAALAANFEKIEAGTQLFGGLADIANTTKAAMTAVRASTVAQTIAQGALNAIMAINPIFLVVAAIAALVAGFVIAYKRSDRFRAVVDKAFTGIKKVVTTVVATVSRVVKATWDTVKKVTATLAAAVKKAFTGIRDAVAKIVTTIRDKVTGVFKATRDTVATVVTTIRDKVTGVFKATRDTVATVVTTIRDKVTGVFKATRDTVATIVTTIRDKVTGVFKATRDTVATVVTTIRDKVTGVFKATRDAVSTTWTNLKEDVLGAVRGIRDSIGAVLTSIRTKVKTAFTGAKTAATTAFTNLVDGVSDAIGDVLDYVTDLPGDIVDAVGDLGSLLSTAGANVIEGLADGIRGAIGLATDAISDVVGAVTDYLPWSPAKRGPLARQRPEDGGANIVDLLAAGMTSEVGQVTSAASTIATAATIPLDETYTTAGLVTAGRHATTGAGDVAAAGRGHGVATGRGRGGGQVTQNFYGPQTGREVTREMEWAMRYAT